MSAYSLALEELELELNTYVDTLNNYANLANNATTEAQYNSYVSKYNATKSSYDSTVSDYNSTADSLTTLLTVQRAEQFTIDLPNPKDRSQWLAGGTLKNETYPGGQLWSPVAIPSIDNKKYVDSASNLLNGNVLSNLNIGFESVQALVMGGALDLMFNKDIIESRTIRVSISVSTASGAILYSSSKDSILYNNEGNSEYNANGYENVNVSTANLEDLSKAWNAQKDITSLLNANPVKIAMTLYDFATNTEVSVETRLTGAVLGTVYSTFKSLAFQGIAQLANVTAMSPAVYVGYGLFSAIFGELAEMALGLDNHLGFGGDYIGMGLDGKAQYADKQDFMDGMTDFLGETLESISFGFFDYTSDYDLQKSYYSSDMARFGHAIDMGYTSYDDGWMSGFNNTGGTYGGDVSSNAINTDMTFGTNYSSRNYNSIDGYTGSGSNIGISTGYGKGNSGTLGTSANADAMGALGME